MTGIYLNGINGAHSEADVYALKAQVKTPPNSGVVQAPHGGQEWRQLSNFVEDFSVTTNSQKPPASAVAAAMEEMTDLEHYPAQDFEPAVSDLAGFLAGEVSCPINMRERLVMGNGASELIDLVIRLAPKGAWKPGPSVVQYKEYARSAGNTNRAELSWKDKSAALTCMVNPCNPTGDYMPIVELKAFIESNCADGSWVVVDESMQPWLGPTWREDSLVGQGEWIAKMKKERGICIYCIHSWTKLWSCPGIRLGSVVAPTAEDATEIRRIQVPWSVNSPGLAFTTAAINDKAYLEKTWRETPINRRALVDAIQAQFPTWKLHGKTWSSWVWIDTGSSDVAQRAVDSCKANGVPIRWGKYGYNMPTFIRIGVRSAHLIPHLMSALIKNNDTL